MLFIDFSVYYSVLSKDAEYNPFGISVAEENTGNLIRANRALNNTNVDMFDGNAHCDRTVWKRNQFGTANQARNPCGCGSACRVASGPSACASRRAVLARPTPEVSADARESAGADAGSPAPVSDTQTRSLALCSVTRSVTVPPAADGAKRWD